MMLQEAIHAIFLQLSATIAQLSDGEYQAPCNTLYNSSIGQHVRHIIELYQSLDIGYAGGLVNYEERKRDHVIETDKQLAAALLDSIYAGLDREDKTLLLETFYDVNETSPFLITSNYYRELAYNLEHSIHHMALIRVGISEVSNIILPEDFGVASSTLKHRKQCAQ